MQPVCFYLFDPKGNYLMFSALFI